MSDTDRIELLELKLGKKIHTPRPVEMLDYASAEELVGLWVRAVDRQALYARAAAVGQAYLSLRIKVQVTDFPAGALDHYGRAVYGELMARGVDRQHLIDCGEQVCLAAGQRLYPRAKEVAARVNFTDPTPDSETSTPSGSRSDGAPAPDPDGSED